MAVQDPPLTFGRYIAQERKKQGLSQKELANRIRRGDEDRSITPQYLNDIEHDRRSPSSEDLIDAIAEALQVDADVLAVLAGRLPADVSAQNLSDAENLANAMKLFRKTSARG